MDTVSETINNLYNFSNSGQGFWLYDLFHFIGNFFNNNTVAVLKLASVVICLVLVLMLLVIMARTGRIAPAKPGILTEVAPPEPAEGGATQARWNEIQKHADSTKEAEWKMAVIEADKLMEDVLKKAGFPGETMGERLMSIQKGQLQSLDYIWEAHKIRNRLAHDTNYFLRHAEAQRAVKLFSRALEELQVL